MENTLYWANWLSKQEFVQAINDQVLRLHASNIEASVFATPQQTIVMLPGFGEARISLNRDSGRLDHENSLEFALMFGIASRAGGKIIISHSDGTAVQGIEQMAEYVSRALDLMDKDETNRILNALGLVTPRGALQNAKHAMRLSTVSVDKLLENQKIPHATNRLGH